MSPEQASAAKDVDGRADVYALGVVIFQCLTGRVPFEASSFPALLAKIMVEQPPPMSAFRSGLPQALEEVVLRAMAKDPRGRYATMSEVAAALVPFGAMNDAPVMAKSVDPLGVTHPPKDTGTPEAWETGGRTGPERHRSPMVLIGAAVLVAGMLGAGITLWLTRGDEVAASSAGGPVLPVVVGSAVEIPSSDADGPALVIEEPTAVAELEHAPTQVVDEAPPSPQPEATETPHRSTLRRRVPASTPAEPTTSPMLTPTAMTTSAAGARTIQIRNDRRAETVVELACDTESRTVTVSARGTTGVSLPAADCRVRCRGVGEPRCPLVLGAGQQTLVVR
jgi:serine/threonine-protein kinase